MNQMVQGRETGLADHFKHLRVLTEIRKGMAKHGPYFLNKLCTILNIKQRAEQRRAGSGFSFLVIRTINLVASFTEPLGRERESPNLPSLKDFLEIPLLHIDSIRSGKGVCNFHELLYGKQIPFCPIFQFPQ